MLYGQRYHGCLFAAEGEQETRDELQAEPVPMSPGKILPISQTCK
jgi:predicted adenine nucleotide alpha hydrolase (AANH) superfamily ATPase